MFDRARAGMLSFYLINLLPILREDVHGPMDVGHLKRWRNRGEKPPYLKRKDILSDDSKLVLYLCFFLKDTPRIHVQVGT